MRRLDGRLRLVADIQKRERNEMFALMNRYFANVNRAQFDADLDEKLWAIQMVDPTSGHIRGFSTQTLIEQHFDGRPILAVFSGDTIVDPDYWGPNVLAGLDEIRPVADRRLPIHRSLLVFDHQQLSHLSLSAGLLPGILPVVRAIHPRLGGAIDRRLGRPAISDGL